MVVLVQHGLEDVLCPVAEEDAGRLGVHIGFHVGVRCPVRAVQHVLQHRIGAGSLRVQLDDLAPHRVHLSHRSLVVGHALAAGALGAQGTAQLLHPFRPGVPFALAVEVGLLQSISPGGLAQHLIHVQA